MVRALLVFVMFAAQVSTGAPKSRSLLTKDPTENGIAENGIVVDRRLPRTSTPEMEFAMDVFAHIDIEPLALALNEALVLPRRLTIVTAQCGSKNAHYQPRNNVIVICYDLVKPIYDAYVRHVGHEPRKSELPKMTEWFNEAIMAFFLHELAHAFIHEYSVPVTGREEDVADSFAAFMAVQGFVRGRHLVSGMYSLLSMDHARRRDPTWQNPFDKHSFSQKRLSLSACIMYGANRRKYAGVKRYIRREELAGGCKKLYNKTSDFWNEVLEVHMRY